MEENTPTQSSSGSDTTMAAIATIPLIGLIFYFTMKDASNLVKHYAKQSIGLLVISIVLMVVSFVLMFIPFIGAILSFFIWFLYLLMFLLWVFLFINALQGKMFRVPVMSDLLDNLLK